MSDFGFEIPDEPRPRSSSRRRCRCCALKDTVVFPQSMMPLAIGQERSIRLIDDVVAGDRLLALVTARDASIESPGLGRHLRRSGRSRSSTR